MWDFVKATARELKVYAFGKGLLSLAVMTTAAVSSFAGVTSFWIPALLVSAGGLALTTVSRLYRQSLREEEMVDLYRNSIAAALHIAPEDVTRKHLKAAARDNHIIDEALRMERKKTILAIGTAALAASVTLLTLGIFDAHQTLKDIASKSFTGMLQPMATLVGMGTVAGISSLVLHQGLDAVIGYSTGIHRATTHDLIRAMDNRIKRGGQVVPEQVFGVMVASNPDLKARIQREFGKGYAAMNREEQRKVIVSYGLEPIMNEVHSKIGGGRMQVSELADLAERYYDLAQASKAPEAAAEVAPARESFVERFAPKSADANRSHVEQVSASRVNAGELSHV